MAHNKIAYLALALSVAALALSLMRHGEPALPDRYANARPGDQDTGDLDAHGDAILHGPLVWVVPIRPIQSLNAEFGNGDGRQCITRRDWLHPTGDGHLRVDTPFESAAGTMCPKGAIIDLNTPKPDSPT